MKQFNDLGLAKNILHAVSAEGYTTPTPIQADVIPTALTGRDIVGIAQTGTGKTAAFVLPILHKIMNDPKPLQPKSCRALILAPTRELAAQIADSIRTYGKQVHYSVAVIVGGVKPSPQIRALKNGVDIIVATPGRLEDHVSTRSLRLDLTTTVVLDEADQMMDMGFIPAIRRIMDKTSKKRQTLLFSATMPKQIRQLASAFLDNPAEVSVAPQSRPVEKIEQRVHFVDKAEKRKLMVDILKEEKADRTIVFTRTKHMADRVMRHLQKAGLTADAIHGNKSQGQRQRALAAFKKGRTDILVATDIAARGIDVDNISHVINYELPNVPEAYVHRIGRTARAGKTGVAISLCDRSERAFLRDIEKIIGKQLSKNAPANDDGEMAEQEQSPARRNPRKKNHRGQGAKTGQGPKSEDGRPARKPRFHGKPKTAKSGPGSSGGSGRPQRRRNKPKAA